MYIWIFFVFFRITGCRTIPFVLGVHYSNNNASKMML